jgi:hypothetical protein
MADAPVESQNACDAFLCHVGKQTNNFMDCLHRILLRMGGVQGKRQRALNVYWDQRGIETCKHDTMPRTDTPWPAVEEHEAQNCRIGGATDQPHTELEAYSTCDNKAMQLRFPSAATR